MNATSPLPPEQQFRAERRKKTHRGRRSRGKGPKPSTAAAGAVDHMAEANRHIKAAHADPTKQGTHAHLFRAITALKKAAC